MVFVRAQAWTEYFVLSLLIRARIYVIERLVWRVLFIEHYIGGKVSLCNRRMMGIKTFGHMDVCMTSKECVRLIVQPRGDLITSYTTPEFTLFDA